MKKVILAVLMMVVLGSQSAMALTPMTDDSLGSITAQSGIGTILNLNGMSQASSDHLAKGVVETEIHIEDTVIDIDRLEISFLKSGENSFGNLSMSGIHMEVGKASISIWEH